MASKTLSLLQSRVEMMIIKLDVPKLKMNKQKNVAEKENEAEKNENNQLA